MVAIMKKSYRLAFAVLLPFIAAAASSAAFLYSVESEEVTITGYTGSEANLEIPATLDGIRTRPESQ